MSSSPADLRCDVCGRQFPKGMIVPATFVRDPVSELIKKDHPDWNDDRLICLADLNRYRSDYVQASLQQERGELSELEQQVLESLREHELLAENVNEEFEQQTTFGEQIADRVASFGGSWTFLITFGAVLGGWVLINSAHLMMTKPFDPYPYILLNLLLSCVAAVQAPVIMMSQNRQEDKDRLRGEHDYRVNLKAELEIRHLHSKLDLLLTHQWQRLLEIQQLQTDLLEEIADRES